MRLLLLWHRWGNHPLRTAVLCDPTSQLSSSLICEMGRTEHSLGLQGGIRRRALPLTGRRDNPPGSPRQPLLSLQAWTIPCRTTALRTGSCLASTCSFAPAAWRL